MLRTAILKVSNRGAFWSIDATWASEMRDKGISVQPDEVKDLSSIPTRLKALDTCTKQRLINWGYVAADKALRKQKVSAPTLVEASYSTLPFPDAGLAHAMRNEQCGSDLLKAAS